MCLTDLMPHFEPRRSPFLVHLDQHIGQQTINRQRPLRATQNEDSKGSLGSIRIALITHRGNIRSNWITDPFSFSGTYKSTIERRKYPRGEATQKSISASSDRILLVDKQGAASEKCSQTAGRCNIPPHANDNSRTFAHEYDDRLHNRPSQSCQARGQ